MTIIPTVHCGSIRKIPMRRSIFMLVLAVSAFVPCTAAAQVQDRLEQGTRIRVWLAPQSRAVEGAAREQRIRGTLSSFTSDSLTVSIHPEAAPLTIAWPGVKRLDRSRGVPSPLESALWRGVQMAALGAVEFAILDRSESRFGSTGKAMLVGGATGAGVGMALGLLFPQERWSRIRLARP